MARKQIFISHISKETTLARALKERILVDFGKKSLDVFVSSDRTTIEAGSKWLQEIERALKAADLVMVMASRESVARPWVNFEAGAVWLKGVPLIPICHSGMTPAGLPTPLNLLQGTSIDNAEGLQKVYDAIARQIEVATPSVDFKAMARDFTRVVEQLEATAPAVETVRDPRILCVANPQYSEAQFRFDLDVAALEEAFPGRVTVEWNCSRKRFTSLLVSERFDIVYIVMPLHPTSGALVFSSVDAETNVPLDDAPETVTPERLADLLVEAKTRLVVFATCRAAWSAVDLARVANVVATEQDVTGTQTSEWAGCYFGHLAGGVPVFKAFDLTRKQVDTPMRIVRQADVAFAV